MALMTTNSQLTTLTPGKRPAAIRPQDGDVFDITAEALKTMRLNRGETQSRFWKRFGVSQSSGSRFERGLESMPNAVAILVRLYWDGVISEGDLRRARRRFS
jgi:hypothetical protein